MAAVQAATAWAIAVSPAVHEAVVVLDVTSAVAEQVRAPAAVAVHRAWEVSGEVVAAAEVLAAVAEAVAVAVVAVVAVVAEAEGGNKS
ncbi:MAG TPA: hypothetical protein VM656_14605 [Pyrinomonadaceae bacterium]|nr:hypothetical protein [Pyrinomonadaceae bacterium]